jgi:hypothetical protein
LKTNTIDLHPIDGFKTNSIDLTPKIEQLEQCLLDRRVGSVSIELQERVKSLSLERLEELHDAAIDFTNLTDLEAWFSQKWRSTFDPHTIELTRSIF